MNDPQFLVVPLAVEALVVNDSVRTVQPFVRGAMNYNVLQMPANAEPGPLATDTNFASHGDLFPGVSAARFYNGAYLKWRLPEALRLGTQDNSTSATTYPVVPNRWLVVRLSGPPEARTSTAWLIESDCLAQPVNQPANLRMTGSAYVRATRNASLMPVGTQIGCSVPLATTPWTESGHSLSLTAVAPGNLAFATYQPGSNNVFSFVDPLNDFLDPMGKPYTSKNPAILSYMVFGWYAVPGEDPLSGDATLAEKLAALAWTLPPGTPKSATANATLCSGFVTGVTWQSDAPPPSAKPTGPLSIAVGSSSVSALTALVEQQAGEPLAGGVQPDLFEAFQFDLLSVLDEPDGQALLAEKLHAASFRKHAGGYAWEIVDSPDATTPPSPDQQRNEAAWLATLNADQVALDTALETLASLQRQLYEVWWKYIDWDNAVMASVGVPGLSRAWLRAQLDSATPGTLAAQVLAQANTAAALQDNVPSGSTPEALRQAIEAYAQKAGLPAGRVLKRIARPGFFMPNEPVVLISGAGSGDIFGGKGGAMCRLPSQLVTGLRVGATTVTATTEKLAVPVPSVANVSGVPWLAAIVAVLTTEFFFLDPDSARQIAAQALNDASDATIAAILAAQDSAADIIGILPCGAASKWRANPWRPLLLAWQVTYVPILHGPAAAPNWRFDGDHYQWNGAPAAVGNPALQHSGRILLTPQATVNIDNRITAFLATVPNLDPQERGALVELQKFVQKTDSWDLLSQALNGFNAQLTMQMPGTYVGPAAADGVAANLPFLIGSSGGYPPDLGTIPPSPARFSTSFQPWRAGQFYFTSLAVIDEWGQSLQPVTLNNYQQVTIASSPDLAVVEPVLSSGAIPPLFQLNPTLLQGGRLNFDWISPNDDPGRAITDAGPICGWILPNHLDVSVSAYDPNGVALGELSVVAGGPVVWTPMPDSPYADLDALAASLPQLGAMMKGLQARTRSEFFAFLEAVDEALWTTEPAAARYDQNLAVLIGRPLALVRAQLKFAFEGLPLSDPSWQFTITPSRPAILDYRFDIMLGATGRLDDGLIGYYADDEYGIFNIVPESQAAQDGYLKPIGPGNFLSLPFDGTTTARVSMLVDPLAPIHAITAILPDIGLTVPPALVDRALGAMKVAFRMGPILADQTMARQENGDGSPVVAIPLPAFRGGAWSWMEQDEAGWSSYPVQDPVTTATLTTVPPVLRQGLLILSPPATDSAN